MSQSDHTVEASTTTPIPSGFVHSPTARWFLVDGNRWTLAGLLSVVVFAVVFGLGWVGVIGVARPDPVTLLLSVLIGGNLTLVPITITINQLVLSREFGKPHELRERDGGVKQLRRDLEELAGVSLIPPAPEAFVRELLELLEDSAESIAEAAAATDDEEFQRRADDYRRRVVTGTERVEESLDGGDFGSYDLLSAMLRVNSAWLIETSRYLRDGAPEGAPTEPFERMAAALRLFNVTRQYTKTLYTQKEISTLSRLLLYAGFVAVLSASLTMLFYATPIDSTLSHAVLLAAFAAVMAVVFLPLAFLVSYMLRLSTLMSYPPLRNSFITDG